MSTLFISDLHLDQARPDTLDLARHLIEDFAPRFEALYILGDFIEYWIGDDYCHPAIRGIFHALSRLSARKVAVRLMHGNRDFLLSPTFAAQFGIELISGDELCIDLYGTPALLMHGDTLCTDDTDYQRFRTQVRSARWQAAFLARPLNERIAVANELRETSRKAVQGKPATIMDVNQQAVAARMQQQQVALLIHGHTHRPARHVFDLSGQSAVRYVLGEWRAQAEILLCSVSGQELIRWP